MTSNKPAAPRVWLVTGAGRGLGRAFAQAALDDGDLVAATARRGTDLDDLVAAHGDRFAAFTLDVRRRDDVLATVDEVVERFGRLDVLVNNAGYGYVAATEEVSEREAREQLDTNFFGALWATQAALRHMRSRGSGDIVQISTVGAVGTMPTFGMYNASKWALEAFSEALAKEVAPHGVHVTIAELGGFATDWGGVSMRFGDPLPAYDELRTAIFGSAAPWDEIAAGEQDPGDDADPATAAHALLEHLATGAAERPLRLLVGDDAPVHTAMALAARRDDYRRNPRFTWPE